jgi:hypothetical protein
VEAEHVDLAQQPADRAVRDVRGADAVEDEQQVGAQLRRVA